MTTPSPGTPWQPVRPDAQATALVARSLGRPEALAARAESFVAHLTQLAPAPGLGESLTPPAAERLLASILTAITTLSDGKDADAAEQAEEELRDLGSWLNQAGLDAEGLRGVGYALVRMAREMAGPQWTTSVGSAWASVQAWLVDHLVQGARRQPTLVTPMAPIPALGEEAAAEDPGDEAAPEGGPRPGVRYERLVQRLSSGPFGRRR